MVRFGRKLPLVANVPLDAVVVLAASREGRNWRTLRGEALAITEENGIYGPIGGVYSRRRGPERVGVWPKRFRFAELKKGRGQPVPVRRIFANPPPRIWFIADSIADDVGYRNV